MGATLTTSCPHLFSHNKYNMSSRGFRNVALDPRNKEIIKRAIEKDALSFMLSSFLGGMFGAIVSSIFFVGLGAFVF